MEHLSKVRVEADISNQSQGMLILSDCTMMERLKDSLIIIVMTRKSNYLDARC